MNPTTEDSPYDLTIDYAEHDLKQILQYFVNGYQLQEGEIYNHEAFVDPVRGKVMFKLFVKIPKKIDNDT